MPKFTVIVPTYNRETFLNRTVGSVLAQTFVDFELVIVDDCSPVPIKPFEDPRVRVIRHETNGGLAVARNTGQNAATGDLVLFLDDDDWIAPDRLQWAADGIGENRAHAAGIVQVLPDGSQVRFGGPFQGDIRRKATEVAPPIVGQVIWRREDLVPWEPSLRTGQDVEWLMRMTHAAIFAWEPQVGYFWQIHHGHRHARQSMVPARQMIVEKHWKTSSRIARDGQARRLAVAYLNNGQRWPGVRWALRAFTLSPKWKTLKLVAAAALGKRSASR